MKKILLYIATIFMLIGCTDDLSSGQWKENTGEKVELRFKVNIPEASSAASRSFDSPSVETLHLIVFDNNGYFVEKVLATKEKTIVSDTEVTEFKATLTASASQRTIHFIGNYAGADNLPFGSESDIIGGLKHSNENDAYWQRMTFGSINDDTDTKMGTVPLLRNHAKITVEVDDNVKNFKLESFTVVNVVTEGYLAPYNMDKGRFAQFMDIDANGAFTQTNNKFNCRSYLEITTGSDSYVPGTVGLNLKTTIDAENLWKGANGAFYLYERNFVKENYTFALVKGKWTNAVGEEQESSYYKVDLVYQNADGVTQYYNLLRNFCYRIVIKQVTGNGKSSAQEAHDMTGSHNNLAASVETQSLTNISDGASQLYVSYTEEYIVSDAPVTLQYMYIPDAVGNKGTTSNGSESVSIVCATNGDVIKEYLRSDTNDTDQEGNDTGWRTITITPQKPDANEAKKQTLTITAGNLSRTITYILRTPYVMGMQCYDGDVSDKTDKNVNLAISQKVNVDITLPTGLPETLFPLTFFIEAEKRTLYPDATVNQLPVDTDIPSLFNGGSTFGYTKEITWDNYNNNTNKLFICYLLTNTEENASKVKVYNKYFSVAEDYFTNPDLSQYNKVSIPGGNITAQGQYIEDAYNQTWNIYTDSNFTNSIGTCSFTSTETSNGWWGPNTITYSLNALTLYIPKDVTIVYFACTSGGYTYYTSMSVTELKDAQNNSGKVLQIDHRK